MALKKIEQLSEYVKHLQGNREELDDLYRDLLIHVTSFFRDPEVFRALRNKILPQILARKPPGDPIRIWVPGCSTGEEAYSIAICLLESAEGSGGVHPIQIFASDISEQAIDQARAGVYPKDALKKVSRGARAAVLYRGERRITRSSPESANSVHLCASRPDQGSPLSPGWI